MINNLNYEVVQDMERINPGALKNICTLLTLNLQIEKENYERKQRKTKRK